MTWVVEILHGLAIVMAVAGNIGVLRLPDVYSRLQASSTCGTTAVFSVFLAAMVSSGFTALTGKLVVMALFFLVSSPVSAHIVARYAWDRGIMPRRRRGPRAPEDRR